MCPKVQLLASRQGRSCTPRSSCQTCTSNFQPLDSKVLLPILRRKFHPLDIQGSAASVAPQIPASGSQGPLANLVPQIPAFEFQGSVASLVPQIPASGFQGPVLCLKFQPLYSKAQSCASNSSLLIPGPNLAYAPRFRIGSRLAIWFVDVNVP